MKLKNLHYGWVLVIIAACVLGTYAMSAYTRGIFLKSLTNEFNWDRGAVSGAYSASMIVAGLLAVFSGKISDKYGPRIVITFLGLLTGIGLLLMWRVNSLWQLYLIWGFFIGVGGSCGIAPITATVAKWFTKKRGLAIGIIFAGWGLGSMLWPPVAQWLISTFGWQQTYLILGLATLTVIISLAQFTKRNPQQIGLKPFGERESIEDKQPLDSMTTGLSFTQAVKSGGFWLISLIRFCSFFSLQVITVHLYPYVVDTGIPPITAAGLLSVVAGAGIISRLSIGFISDRIGSRWTVTACLIQFTLALVGILFIEETWLFFAFAVVFGLAWGGQGVAQTLLITELFGPRSLGAIMGSLEIFLTIGGALGTVLAGSIFDVTGSYYLIFLLCVALGILAVISGLGLVRYKSKIE